MHILFLCVANSARSQMAEGLARHLAPADWTISSAGSQPTTVRPEAIAGLKELNLDISHQHSKSAEAFDPKDIDLVIGLCAEEECPLALLDIPRLHWPVQDPAIEGTERERMDAFRVARDEIQGRIEAYLSEKLSS